MKKIVKIIMIIVMLLGTLFSVSNFISGEGLSSYAVLQGIDYDGDCIDKGTDCDLPEAD